MNLLQLPVSLGDVALLISALAAVAAASVSTYNMLKTLKVSKEMVQVSQEMKEVVHNTNSMKDELVAEVRASSLAKGREEEKASGRKKR